MQKFKMWMLALVALLAVTFGANAATDAVEIANGVSDAFDIIVPIIITIATFFAVLRIAKRVTRG